MITTPVQEVALILLLLIYLEKKKFSMDQGTSSRGRTIKAFRDPDFVYDTDKKECLDKNRSKEDCQPQEVATESTIPSKVTDAKGIPYQLIWTDIEFYPTTNNSIITNKIVQPKIVTEIPKTAEQPNSGTRKKEENSNVIVVRKEAVRSNSRNSSTNFGYLSQSDCFLSVSDIGTNNSPIMSDTEESAGTGARTEEGDDVFEEESDQMLQALQGAIKKIDYLEGKVKSLLEVVGSQNKIIVNQKEQLKHKEESQGESGNNSSGKGAKASSKTGRVLDEKARTLKLLQGKLDLDDIEEAESEEKDQCSDTEEPRSVKGLKKKMTKKQRDLCSSRVAARLRQSGNKFPEDEFDSSGKESCDAKDACRHSKIKSGASIKKRPVLKTELWPHTIANEEDHDDVDSENIGLSKFFTYFTFIMLECKGVQALGRTALLHAISLVLGVFQWSEARCFHNMIMLKIEQGRIGWEDDFISLADTFIEKKIRVSIKSKYTSSGPRAAARASYYGQGAGRGGASYNGQGAGRGSYGHGNQGRGRPMHETICWQWNSGTCSYGNDCRRLHHCKTCAETGKPGEHHKASTHPNSSARSGQGV